MAPQLGRGKVGSGRTCHGQMTQTRLCRGGGAVCVSGGRSKGCAGPVRVESRPLPVEREQRRREAKGAVKNLQQQERRAAHVVVHEPKVLLHEAL